MDIDRNSVANHLNYVAGAFDLTLDMDELADLSEVVASFLEEAAAKKPEMIAQELSNTILDRIFVEVFEAHPNDDNLRATIYVTVGQNLIDMARSLDGYK